MRILWELRDGPFTFAALRARCADMSPSVLNQRLAELRERNLVMLRDEGGYLLTPTGESLLAALAPLTSWAETWSKRSTRRAS